MNGLTRISFGGGCHWCTEAVFQTLSGVTKVEQGYVSSMSENTIFSEAVIVNFCPELISLKALINIHLHTHKSTSNHSMRKKYRSAIYTFNEKQRKQCVDLILELQNEFDAELITQVYPFSAFKPSRDAIRNYYQKNPKKPFCEKFINPKLQLLIADFSNHLDASKVVHLTSKI